MNDTEAIKSLNINMAGAMIAIARPAKRAVSGDALIASLPRFFETLHSGIKMATSLIGRPDDLVGWVERSETRRALQMRRSGGFRCALPTLRFFIQSNHLDDLLITPLMAVIAHRIPHLKQHPKAFLGYQANSARAGP
jgi:hypothetical protein